MKTFLMMVQVAFEKLLWADKLLWIFLMKELTLKGYGKT